MKMRVILIPTMCLIAVAGISFAAGKDAATPSAPAEAVPAKQYESFGNTQIVEMETVKEDVQPQIPCGDCRPYPATVVIPTCSSESGGRPRLKAITTMASLEAGKYCGACHDGKYRVQHHRARRPARSATAVI